MISRLASLFRHAHKDNRSDDEEAARPNAEQVPSISLTNMADKSLQTLTASEERLHIKVGRGQESRYWKVHKALICDYSKYFEQSCQSGFRESLSDKFELDEDDPVAFSLFVEWLYTHSSNKITSVNFDQRDKPNWQCAAEKAWVLGDKLMAPLFCNYALVKVIQNADLMSKKRLQYIDDNTVEFSPIRLFATRMRAWKKKKGSTPHPKLYNIQHWSEACSRPGKPPCCHGPDICNRSFTINPSPTKLRSKNRFVSCIDGCGVNALIWFVVVSAILGLVVGLSFAARG